MVYCEIQSLNRPSVQDAAHEKNFMRMTIGSIFTCVRTLPAWLPSLALAGGGTSILDSQNILFGIHFRLRRCRRIVRAIRFSIARHTTTSESRGMSGNCSAARAKGANEPAICVSGPRCYMKRMKPPLRSGFVGRPRATSEKRSPINSEVRGKVNAAEKI